VFYELNKTVFVCYTVDLFDVDFFVTHLGYNRVSEVASRQMRKIPEWTGTVLEDLFGGVVFSGGAVWRGDICISELGYREDLFSHQFSLNCPSEFAFSTTNLNQKVFSPVSQPFPVQKNVYVTGEVAGTTPHAWN